jgi:hypothetical protein
VLGWYCSVTLTYYEAVSLVTVLRRYPYLLYDAEAVFFIPLGGKCDTGTIGSVPAQHGRTNGHHAQAQRGRYVIWYVSILMLYIFNPIPHGWWTKRAMLKLRPRAMRSIKRIAKYLYEEGMPFGPSLCLF